MQRCPQADSRSDSKLRHLDLGKKEDFNRGFIFKISFLQSFPSMFVFYVLLQIA